MGFSIVSQLFAAKPGLNFQRKFVAMFMQVKCACKKIGQPTHFLNRSILAAIFELKQLVDMMSIGTLLAYSIVAACVLILRYEESEAYEKKDDHGPKSLMFIARQFINGNKLHHSTRLTAKLVSSLVFAYIVLCVCASMMIVFYWEKMLRVEPLPVVLLVLLIASLISILVFVYLQPVSGRKLTFSVPLVPLLPALSIFINIYLMMMLDYMTWIRFGIWMAIGLAVYFLYGIRHSNLRQKEVIADRTF